MIVPVGNTMLLFVANASFWETPSPLPTLANYGYNNKTPTILARELECCVCLGIV
jgi:hypothetical protein